MNKNECRFRLQLEIVGDGYFFIVPISSGFNGARRPWAPMF